MKIYLVLGFVILLIIGCTCSKEICVVDDDFLGDLSSEDNHIAGELYLDVFKGNLDSLSYDYYIVYLSNHEVPSAKGLGDRIKCADQHYFKTSKEGFLVLLYFQSAEKIVGDNSSTAFIDTVINLNKNGPIPTLKEIADKMKLE
jgi:hypothetical protein